MRRGGDRAVLEVADAGPGIAPELRGEATRRFHRAPEARSRPGAGLGLAIVEQLVAGGTRLADGRSGGPDAGALGLPSRSCCRRPGTDFTLPSCARPYGAGMDTALAVEAVDITKRYGGLTAVDDLSLRVAPGEVHGLLGPNGAGKTTLLRMLFGLVPPDSGTVRLFGRTWAEAGVGVLDGVAGFIESPRFYPYLTGRQNLEGLALVDGRGRPASGSPRCSTRSR